MRPALVLAYHGLGSYAAHLDPHNLMVESAHFRRQIGTLRRRGYRFVTLMQVVSYLDDEKLPDGLVAVTFDDGTVDNLELVAPLLSELAVPATIFACPGLLGQPHFAMPPSAEVRLMNADELRALAASPLIEVGSHTCEHQSLATASPEEAETEMANSKMALEELLQRPVNAFAYPECGYSSACPEAARRAGYAVAVTCGGLGGRRRWELARESIDSLDRQLGFALKSRRMFIPLRESLPGRMARRAVRPLRHRSAR
jgi:peptidoglycan/xylan/chitin deacetylase (PgdA/CDA1 family)